MLLLGLDLAWGERNPDGLCLVRATRRRAEILASGRSQGDDALLAWVRKALGPPSDRRRAFAALDAPVVCPNLTGARPVDRLTHRLFARFRAGCYPANLGKCPRPARLAARLTAELGFEVGTGLPPAVPRAAAEVYPHPALVRMLGLPRIIKYKKGPGDARRTRMAAPSASPRCLGPPGAFGVHPKRCPERPPGRIPHQRPRGSPRRLRLRADRPLALEARRPAVRGHRRSPYGVYSPAGRVIPPCCRLRRGRADKFSSGAPEAGHKSLSGANIPWLPPTKPASFLDCPCLDEPIRRI